MVVPTYRFSQSEHALPDAECAYRYGRQIAGDHGGNLGQPVTMFGHSYGASMSLWIGLDEGALGPGGDYLECFEGTDRPNVIVGVAGCYYQHGDETWDFWLPSHTNADAQVTLVAGRDDQECDPWQFRQLEEALTSDGHTGKYVEADGNHMSLMFQHRGITRDEEAEGMQVVSVIRNAIDSASSD